MKYIVILCDGMADLPVEELGGMTPMEKANTPNMDALAAQGTVGMVKTIPQGFTPGSDVANLCVLGYNPEESYSGRSPLEAVSIGIPVNETDTIFRANFVALSEDEDYDNKTMQDYSAGLIPTEQVKVLAEDLNKQLGLDNAKLYAGNSFRGIMVCGERLPAIDNTPPHDIARQVIGQYLIKDDKLADICRRSYDILKNHPINIKRQSEGLKPANSIWIWAQGYTPSYQNFEEKYGLKGAIISAVDLLKGIGICAGMSTPDIKGATGDFHTDYAAKGKAAVELLADHDFVFVHIEAPDECGHSFMLKEKVRSIELIDEKIIGYIREQLSGTQYKMLVLPDHATPVMQGCHIADPVPYMVYNSTNVVHNTIKYNEKAAGECELLEQGYKLMHQFLKRQ